MGAVYRARHTRLKRMVAFKVIASHGLVHAEITARFEREMEAVGRFDHRHIVRAYDAGEANGCAYLAMELLDGFDLAALVRRLGPLRVADACEVVRQSALGLQHAHEHGLVHRDIKPSNLMLTTGGTVKLLDLGLARLRSPLDDELTVPSQLLGTVDYLAPEQADNSHSVDIRADLYSLGCTLFKLLTGRAPFDDARFSTSLQKLAAHQHAAVPDLKMICPNASDTLALILDQLLSKSPNGRFTTPSEVAARLTPLAVGSDLKLLAERAQSIGTSSGTRGTMVASRHDTPIVRHETLNSDRPSDGSQRKRWPATALGAAGGVAAAVAIACLAAKGNKPGPIATSVADARLETIPNLAHLARKHVLHGASQAETIDFPRQTFKLPVGREFDRSKSWTLSFDMFALPIAADKEIVLCYGTRVPSVDQLRVILTESMFEIVLDRPENEEVVRVLRRPHAGLLNHWVAVRIQYDPQRSAIFCYIDNVLAASTVIGALGPTLHDAKVFLGSSSNGRHRFHGKVKQLELLNDAPANRAALP
ncbi:MAG TPA: serine/threonine-protein kinase [Pirellulales bacterium]|nr:serine/threonine-protein kinase [Pirellulales bacterium]